MQERNFNSRNFGMRSRDMGSALVNAYKLNSGNGETTKSSSSTRSHLNRFATYIKTEYAVNDLRKIDRDMVLNYPVYLKNDGLADKSIKNYLSKVNQALGNARLDKKCHVDPKEGGIKNLSGIADRDKSSERKTFDLVKSQVSERFAVILELQRNFGLRPEESCKINAEKALQEAETGKISITRGTKNGRPREIRVTSPQKQIDVLQRAAKIQGTHHSMIPKNLEYHQFRNSNYNELRNVTMNQYGGRHAFAHDRYEQITGVKCAAELGLAHGKEHHNYIAKQLTITPKKARELDRKARREISQDLGHNRLDVTNSYLG